MTKKLAMDMNCGYVDCDIHGAHTARIVVYMHKRDNWGLDPDFSYSMEVYSECFGSETLKALDDRALVEALDKWAILIHIRRNIQGYRRFQRKVRDGSMSNLREFNRLTETIEDAAVPQVVAPAWTPMTVTEEEDWDSVEVYEEDSYAEYNSGGGVQCTCDECIHVRRESRMTETTPAIRSIAEEYLNLNQAVRTTADQLRLFVSASTTGSNATDWSISA